MSTTTKAALDDAIRAHIADESPGCIVTGWHVVAGLTHLADPEARIIHTTTPKGQPAWATTGLIAIAHSIDLGGWSSDD